MNKWILLGIILVSPAILLAELYVISLLIEALDMVIDDIGNIIDTIKDKFGGNK